MPPCPAGGGELQRQPLGWNQSFLGWASHRHCYAPNLWIPATPAWRQHACSAQPRRPLPSTDQPQPRPHLHPQPGQVLWLWWRRRGLDRHTASRPLGRGRHCPQLLGGGLQERLQGAEDGATACACSVSQGCWEARAGSCVPCKPCWNDMHPNQGRPEAFKRSPASLLRSCEGLGLVTKGDVRMWMRSRSQALRVVERFPLSTSGLLRLKNMNLSFGSGKARPVSEPYKLAPPVLRLLRSRCRGNASRC